MYSHIALTHNREGKKRNTKKYNPFKTIVSLTMYHLKNRTKAPCSQRGHNSARKGRSQQSESEAELSVADPFEAQML